MFDQHTEMPAHNSASDPTSPNRFISTLHTTFGKTSYNSLLSDTDEDEENLEYMHAQNISLDGLRGNVLPAIFKLPKA